MAKRPLLTSCLLLAVGIAIGSQWPYIGRAAQPPAATAASATPAAAGVKATPT